MPGKIIIVDDDVEFSRAIARNLRRSGHDVSTCANAAETRSAVKSHRPDVIVLDYNLPDINGLALLSELRRVAVGSELVMVTAYPDLDVAVEAMKRGAVDYVAKGADARECLIRIERAAEVSLLRHRLVEASRPSSAPADELGILGNSPPMQALRVHLEALRNSDDTTTLILGETGTGKSLVARAIHAASGRAFEPFVAVDCTTIPVTLVESELFGYEKGAFSGAVGAKQGRIEAAGRGTLFLDEIGELEMPVQVKLLRLLEEREFTRVGGTRPRKLQARIITATNRDLEKAIQEGRFRDDLKYRLEVFVVELPPLRELGDDIFDLASHFAVERSRALGRPEPSMHQDVLDTMRKYPFPGNVRELKNIVEQAVLLARGPQLLLEDFPVLIRYASGWSPPVTVRTPRAAGSPSQRPSVIPERIAGEGGLNLSISPHEPRKSADRHKKLGQIRQRHGEEERQKLVSALERTGGNLSAAARDVNLSRHQFRRRLVKYGLE
jgi:two-component system, NtrC family, response regulator AtoC